MLTAPLCYIEMKYKVKSKMRSDQRTGSCFEFII